MISRPVCRGRQNAQKLSKFPRRRQLPKLTARTAEPLRPTLVVSFPSLHVPAPPSPKQKFDSGLSFRRTISAPISRPLFSTAFPRSRSFTLKPLDARERAANSPAGPAPTIRIGSPLPSRSSKLSGWLGGVGGDVSKDALSPRSKCASCVRVILHVLTDLGRATCQHRRKNYKHWRFEATKSNGQYFVLPRYLRVHMIRRCRETHQNTPTGCMKRKREPWPCARRDAHLSVLFTACFGLAPTSRSLVASTRRVYENFPSYRGRSFSAERSATESSMGLPAATSAGIHHLLTINFKIVSAEIRLQSMTAFPRGVMYSRKSEMFLSDFK